MSPNMKNAVTVTRTVAPQSSSQETYTSTSYSDLYEELPFYYFPTGGMFLSLGLLIIGISLVVMIAQFAIVSIIAIIISKNGKKYKCPNCGETTVIKGEQPKYCKVCGTSLEPPMCS